jgi:hypothetical protein
MIVPLTRIALHKATTSVSSRHMHCESNTHRPVFQRIFYQRVPPSKQGILHVK